MYKEFPDRFRMTKINDKTSVLMYRVHKGDDRYLIYVPLSMAEDQLGWFHENLLHPGASRLTETVCQMFYIKNLDERAKELVQKCPRCQDSKVTAV